MELGDDLSKGHGGVIHGELLELGQLRHPRPRVLGGGAQQLKDPLQLIVHVTSGKQGSSGVGQL